MKLLSGKNVPVLAALILGGALVAAVACGGETEVVEKTVVVTQEPEVRTEVQTVVVEKEKVVEKEVPQTVVVEKEKVVVATPTPTPKPKGGIPDVPRSRTLIMAGLGGEHPGGFTDVKLFNPHVPGTSRSGMYQATTEGLFYYNMLTGETIPWLATDWEYNGDFTGVTVNLREGTAWSDGEPFTAEDVAFTLKMLRDNGELDRSGTVSRWTDTVEAVDEKTVDISFTQPGPRYVWDLLIFRADVGVPMSPKHIFENQDNITEFSNYDPDKGWPVGTGPYELVSTNIERKIWDLRDDWWGAKTGFRDLPKVERLIFLPGMNEITMAQMLIADEIDMAFSLTVPNYLTVRDQNSKITTHHRGEPPYGYRDWWPVGMSFNTQREPFNNPDVRWAMSYALNRDQIVEFAFAGGQVVKPLPFPSYKPMEKYFRAADPLLEKYPTNEFNPEKSAELMKKNGYTKDGDGFWVDSNGERVSLNIVTFPQHPSTTPPAPVVTEQLRQAGFDAKFSLPADFAQRIASGEADAFIWGHASMQDPFFALNAYHCRSVKPEGEPGWPNIYRWCNEEFSKIVDQMAQLPVDDPEMVPLFEKAMEPYLRELPDIPLVSTIITLPMNQTFWKNWPSAEDPYIHEGFWHRTGLLIFMNLEPVQ